MKNAFDGLISRIDMARGKKISELEDMSCKGKNTGEKTRPKPKKKQHTNTGSSDTK